MSSDSIASLNELGASLQEAPAQHQPSQLGPSTYTRAPKGKACLNCRRRKLKCDCARPVCSQCIRLGREKDCEYAEKDQRTRTEILEADIAVLQARLRELEHPEEVSSSVKLTPLSSWRGSLDEVDMMEHASLYSLGSGSSPDLPTTRHSPPPEPTLPVAQSLIEAFLPFATDVGFFLNPSRFLSWASQHLPPHSPSLGPFSASEDGDPLLSVVYLWGAFFTADGDPRNRCETYLEHAVQSISTAFRPARIGIRSSFNLPFGLNNDEGRPNMIHVIQAEVLLANFMYSAGRFVDARRHTASAVTLVLSCNLHKLRLSSMPHTPSRDISKLRLVPGAEVAMSLPPPVDLVDEGERISAFWQVYILDKTWSHLTGMNSLLIEDGSPKARIDTPWPLAMEQYAEGVTPHEYGRYGRTVEQFFADFQSVRLGPRVSALALRAQAVALLDKAAWLSSTCSPDPSLLRAHQVEFDAVDNLIESFVLTLPSLLSLHGASPPPAPELVRSFALTHALTRISASQLHIAYADENIKSAAKCLSACKAIIGAIQCVPTSQLSIVDPLIIVLLTSTAQTIVEELVRIRDIPTYKQPALSCGNPFYLSDAIEEVVELMGGMNRGSRLTSLQLDCIQNTRSVVSGTDFA